jgi:hypothetical protein
MVVRGNAGTQQSVRGVNVKDRLGEARPHAERKLLVEVTIVHSPVPALVMIARIYNRKRCFQKSHNCTHSHPSMNHEHEWTLTDKNVRNGLWNKKEYFGHHA